MIHNIMPRGDIVIVDAPAALITDGVPMETLVRLPGVNVTEVRNLETQYVLEAIAKSLTGESGKLGDEGVTITPVSMGFGSGTATLQSTSEALTSEILRRYFSTSGSIQRAGTKAVFRINLGTSEAFGPVAELGLFGTDSGAGSVATGVLTVGGAPTSGGSITVVIGGKAIPPLWIGSDTSLSGIASQLRSWLNADGYFSSLYVAAGSGLSVSIQSVGKGTVYNMTLATQVTGGVTCSASGISGGTTPGGQLLAAANTSFTKRAGRQMIVEWSISIKNY